MDSNYCNFPAQNYKTSARRAANLKCRGVCNDNSSPPYAVVSPKAKSQTVRCHAKDFTITRRQQFFCNPNASESKMDQIAFPNMLNAVQFENTHPPLSNANHRDREATINSNNNNFEQISDENCLYENLDAYWKQPHFQAYGQNTISYTTPSELFGSADRKKTPNKDTAKMSDSSNLRPPPLPVKFKRERFAFRMSATSSEADSGSTCSQEHISISNDSDIFCTENSMSSIDSESKIYVNLAEVCASTVRTKTLGSSSEMSMACQQKESVKESPKDSQPPPLPKKTLNRTYSAPGGALLGSSSTKGLPCSPAFQITNPLYGIYEGKSMFLSKTSFSTPCSPLSADENFNLSNPFNRRPGMIKAQSLDEVTNYLPQLDMEKLNFQMPDLDLRNWINFKNQADIFRKLAYRSMMSLKCICTKYTRIFVEDKKSVLKFSESNWPDFKLPFVKVCCHSRVAIYYRAQYIQEPQDEFTLKISKILNQECLEMEREGLLIQESLPVHFNVQQVRGHFVAAIPINLVPTEDTVPCTNASETEMSNDETGAGAEGGETQLESNLNKRRQLVIITQETPYQTMADFVSESTLLHKSEADVYERQISLLLLQLCLGLEHLKGQGVTHCDLRLENLLLVKMSDPGSQAQGGHLQLPKLVIANFSKAKQKSAAIDQKFHPDRARLAPEMMSASQYKMVDEFQLGILIYEILHMSNPFESILRQSEGEEYNPSDLPQIPQLSAYSEGLQHLAHLLLRADPNKRIHIRQAKGILQALLWGPCSKVFSVNTELKDPPHALKNWLDVKRILLMLKFGEWFLDDQSPVTLEDWLCCQYFAYATAESVFQAVEEL